MVQETKRVLIEGIDSSGFPFEHQVYDALRRRKWSVLSNRYYLDSDERRPREIDMVAWKSARHPDYDVRTALIISCKKVESKKWVFMARQDGIDHPNIDWNTMHWSSTYVPFSYLHKQTSWKARFKTDIESNLLEKPGELIFAFQEMEIIKDHRARCCGDSSIRNSVMSAMKALFHELRTRPGRLEGLKPRIYLFNLLTVTNAQMFSMRMDVTPQSLTEVDHVSYLADYILDQQDTSSRVEIVNFSRLDHLLSLYEDMHSRSVQFYANENDRFYRTVLSDADARNLLREEFVDRLALELRMKAYRDVRGLTKSIEQCSLFWDARESRIELLVPIDQEKIEALNQSEPVREATAEALHQVYRYKGDFHYEEDIPF